jgi:hypothetical protein
VVTASRKRGRTVRRILLGAVQTVAVKLDVACSNWRVFRILSAAGDVQINFVTQEVGNKAVKARAIKIRIVNVLDPFDRFVVSEGNMSGFGWASPAWVKSVDWSRLVEVFIVHELQ